MLIDTHCHLGDEKFDSDRAEVVFRARESGVEHVVVISDSREATERSLQIADEFELSATAGVHPHVASDWTAETRSAIEERLRDSLIVAVGETGLDYHYDFSPRDRQLRAFEDQLEMAERFGLPAVIHSRSADEDMVEVIRRTSAKLILHSFSSGRTVLEVGLEQDSYVSFSGMITFKSWSDLESVRMVPDDRLLIETDAPYLAPVPFRGKRNEPAYVRETAARLAELRGVSLERLSSQTTNNARRCFDLKAGGSVSE